jgi:HK97 family phage portal protein
VINLLKDLFDGPNGAVKNASLKQSGWWSQIVSPKTGAGVSITEDNALKIVAVYSCIRIISETIAGLPIHIYRKTDNGREEVDHPLKQVLCVTPNRYQTGFELMEMMVSSLNMRGEAFAHKIINGRGELVALEPLEAKYMKTDLDENNELVFTYQSPDEYRVFRHQELWRPLGLSLNGVTGLSPIGLARESLGIASAAELSAAHLYSNGAQIPGVLEIAAKLDEETIERLRTQWAINQSGPANQFKPLILEHGMQYKETGMKAVDAQFLESRKFQITEIARIFRVPLHKLQEMDHATFSNIEHQSIEFVTDTILPWVVKLEQSLARDIFTPSEKQNLFIKFNLSGLLRGDTATRYEAYSKAITDGWLNRNEVRQLEDLNPVEGLDEHLVPLNMGGASDNQPETDSDAENTTETATENSVVSYLAKREVRDSKNLKPEKREKFYTSFAETMVELGAQPQKAADYAVKRIKDDQPLDIEAVKQDLGAIYE